MMIASLVSNWREIHSNNFFEYNFRTSRILKINKSKGSSIYTTKK